MYYICIRGRKPGIFETTWEDFEVLVKNYSGCLHEKRKGLKEALRYWTKNRNRVSKEYFSADYENLYPYLKLVDIKKIKDTWKKETCDNTVNYEDTEESNLNFTFKKDDYGSYNDNKNEVKKYIDIDNNNQCYEKEKSPYDSNCDNDDNISHFGGTNPMNSKSNNDILINPGISNNRISTRNNIIGISAREIPDMKSNCLGCYKKEKSSYDSNCDNDNSIPHFGGTNPMNSKSNNDILINSGISNRISDRNNIIGISVREIPDMKSNCPGRIQKEYKNYDTYGSNNSKIIKKDKKKEKINSNDRLNEFHCDSIQFDGYDATIVLDAIDAIVKKIKEMLK